MGVLAGIHLVHEEGAEPAAFGVPRVTPARQWVSTVGLGLGQAPTDTPSLEET